MVRSSPKHLVVLFALILGSGTVEASDEEQRWRRLLLDADPAVQTDWAQRYEHAEGVSRNIGRAVLLYCQAARQGHAEAQYRLGWLYTNGRGIDRDDALAAAWFRLAARQGDDHARRMFERIGSDTEIRHPQCVLPEEMEPYTWLAGEQAPARGDIEDAVRLMAPGYGLDPMLVLAVIQAESNFDSRARSPKGALGLMQLIPKTARRFGVRDILDPVQNLQGGMAYLRWLLEHFDGKVSLALAGYNAGEQAVKRFGGVPPYNETRAYVRKIARVYPQTTHLIASGL